MEKTIKMMKESGLFDSLVQNIYEEDMPKEAVAVALDEVCAMDENFETTLYSELHDLGLSIIWKELMTAVNCLPTKPEQKQEDKYEFNPADFEQVLMDKMVNVAMKKFEDLIDAIITDALKNNK